MFHPQAFTQSALTSLDQTVAQPSAAIITTLTSKTAQRKYALILEIGQRLAEILRLVVLATLASINEIVKDCEAQPEPQINQPTAAKVMPAQAVAVVKVEQSTQKESKAVVGAKTEMTVKELRALCTERGIRWNRAGEGGKKQPKHLTRNEMISALGL